MRFPTTVSTTLPSTLTSGTFRPTNSGALDSFPAPDYEVVDAHHVRLRAERSGTGGGRVYSIAITCLNGAGMSVQTVPVTVPSGR